jgi:UDPglucose 6-dehydrogenase
MKICVSGLWHLGSVTAACLADKGFDITGWDPDPVVIKNLSASKAPIFEPGLNELIAKGIQTGKLHFSSSAEEAVRGADILWITFDTPVDDEDRADDTWVKNQIKSLAKYLIPFAGIIISSQLPVGSCAELEGNNPICYSPENLRLGKAIEIFQNPDRLIAGIRRPEDKEIFEPVFKAITPRVEWMKTESAEMTKHAINSFLALSITFANELAALCESTGADAREVERGLKTESRIGPKAYLKAGAAFAGGTLARDVRFLSAIGQKHGHPPLVINAILESNRHHQSWAKQKLQKSLNPLKGKRVAILGLTYKEGTDTLRRSWAIELARWLHQEGVEVRAYDWQLSQLPQELKSILSLQSGSLAALEGSDALVVGTDHPGLKKIQTAEMRLMRNALIIDPNGTLNGPEIASLTPLDYCSVGFSIHRKVA